MQKICTTCKVEQPLENYSKCRKSPMGRRAKCNPCRKEYRAANASRISASKKKCYEAKKDQYQARHSAYKKANKGKINANTKAYKVAKKGQTPDMSQMEKSMIEAMYWMASVLGRSCGESFHIDHITPISKGGLHNFENLQILSAEENLKKGNRID